MPPQADRRRGRRSPNESNGADALGRQSADLRETGTGGDDTARSTALENALRIGRRRLPIIVACLVLVPAMALIFSLTQDKEYSATASLLFRDPQLDQKLFGSSFIDPVTDPQRQAATNLELVSLRAVAEQTAQALDRADVAAGDIAAAIEVSEQGESDLVSVKAQWPDPAFAARLANTFAEQYIAFRRDADQSKIEEARTLVDSQIAELSPAEQATPEGQQLRESSQQLAVLASLQTGNAELVQPAAPPSSASSPSTKRNLAAGLLLGLMLGVGLAFLWEQLDRRLKDEEEIEEIFSPLPILASIPFSRVMMRAQGRSGSYSAMSPPEIESFRLLRANVRYFNVNRDIKSIVTTSASPGDGKTTVAWNLALAAAEAGKKVLLIEADLRRPMLAERLGRPNETGLSLVLAGVTPFAAALTHVGSDHVVDVLLAGPAPPNPTELSQSDRMQELIQDAENRYDAVIIDTPPTALVADAIPLLNSVDGVLVVARLQNSRRDAAMSLHNQLMHLGAPVLGLVLNGVSLRGKPDYYYGDRPPGRTLFSTDDAAAQRDSTGYAERPHARSTR